MTARRSHAGFPLATVLIVVACVTSPAWPQTTSSVANDLNRSIRISQRFESTITLETDPAILALADRVGQVLTRNSDATVPISFNVVASPDINVFAIKGFVYVTTGLIASASTEAEFAFALAHGVARHSAKIDESGGRTIVELVGPVRTTPSLFPTGTTTSNVILEAGIAGAVLRQTGMGQGNDERMRVDKADTLAVQILYNAGYDPGAATSFLQSVQARMPASQADPKLSTHPPVADRLKKVQKWTRSKLRPRESNAVTTGEFDDIHRRLCGC
jgi:predicted Zn-dependent protease